MEKTKILFSIFIDFQLDQVCAPELLLKPCHSSVIFSLAFTVTRCLVLPSRNYSQHLGVFPNAYPSLYTKLYTNKNTWTTLLFIFLKIEQRILYNLFSYMKMYQGHPINCRTPVRLNTLTKNNKGLSLTGREIT